MINPLIRRTTIGIICLRNGISRTLYSTTLKIVPARSPATRRSARLRSIFSLCPFCKNTKYHSSPLSTIYYCTVARTIDKSINTGRSFASIWKGKCAFFHYFDKKEPSVPGNFLFFKTIFTFDILYKHIAHINCLFQKFLQLISSKESPEIQQP